MTMSLPLAFRDLPWIVNQSKSCDHVIASGSQILSLVEQIKAEIVTMSLLSKARSSLLHSKSKQTL